MFQSISPFFFYNKNGYQVKNYIDNVRSICICQIQKKCFITYPNLVSPKFCSLITSYPNYTYLEVNFYKWNYCLNEYVYFICA